MTGKYFNVWCYGNYISFKILEGDETTGKGIAVEVQTRNKGVVEMGNPFPIMKRNGKWGRMIRDLYASFYIDAIKPECLEEFLLKNDVEVIRREDGELWLEIPVRTKTGRTKQYFHPFGACISDDLLA